MFKKKQILKTNVLCQISNKMISCRDEELAEKIKQLPVKSNSHFHRKDLKNNVWVKVAEELEFENGECCKIEFVCTRSTHGNMFLKIHALEILRSDSK